MEGISLIYVGEDAREDTDTVERVTLGGKVSVRKRRVLPQHEQARRHGQDQRFEVLEGIVARAPDVGRRKESEDVVGALWKLPELRWHPLARLLPGPGGRDRKGPNKDCGEAPYRCPVWVVGRDVTLLRQPEDALFELELRATCTHFHNMFTPHA